MAKKRESKKDRLSGYQEELNRAKRYRQDKGYDALWHRMNDLYAGKFMPHTPGQDNMKVNLAFSTVNVIVPNISLNYPRIGVVARRPEDEDRAVISEQIMNYWWKHYNFHKSFQSVVKDSVIYGFGFAKVGWAYLEEEQMKSREEITDDFREMLKQQKDATIRDPALKGELPTAEDVFNSLEKTKTVPIEDRPFHTRISVHDIYVNPEAKTMDDLRWIAQRILTRKDMLSEDKRYSATARNEASPGFVEVDGTEAIRDVETRYEASEWVVVWEFYDIEKKEMSTFVDSSDKFLLAPRAIPYAYGHPYQMLRNYDVPDEFYPKGDLEEIEDFVLEVSLTRSQMMQWRTKYASKYLVRDGAIDAADISKLTSRKDGQIIPVKDDNVDLGDVVRPVPINTLDSKLFDWSAQINRDVNEVSGVSEFARGTGAGSTQTATEASLIQDAQNARSQSKLTAVENFISEVSRKLQQLGQQFLTGEQYVRVAGKDAAALFVPYERDDISGEFDFAVEAGSTEPQNETFRRQQGIALMQTMMPFLEMQVIDPLKLAEHVMREAFNVRNASKFMTPDAFEQLKAMKQAESEANVAAAQGAPAQQGALAAPQNGQGLDTPQPPPANQADLGQQAQDDLRRG
jgi:hypothetical protein